MKKLTQKKKLSTNETGYEMYVIISIQKRKSYISEYWIV